MYVGTEVKFHILITQVEVTGQFHDPAALPPGKEPPIYRRPGGPQGGSGRYGEKKNLRPNRISNPNSPIVQYVA
jgi:hypothetical protein